MNLAGYIQRQSMVAGLLKGGRSAAPSILRDHILVVQRSEEIGDRLHAGHEVRATARARMHPNV